MTTNSITNLSQAYNLLKNQENCYLSSINLFMLKLLNSHEEWVDILELESDVTSQITQLYNICPDWITQVSVGCVVFNHLHDLIMPLVYQKCEIEDEFYMNKAIELKNITSEQIGAPVECTITLSAAVVELASLDYHKSPLEKMWCLCTTYDFIFAELKSALINVFSKYSGRDSDIPVVNNADIIPILITVILQSKLTHLYSNFYYLDLFMGCLSENEQFRHVMMMFHEAINRIVTLSLKSVRPGSVTLCREMDLIKLIQVTDEMNTKLRIKESQITPFEGQLIDVTELIVTSTNQNQILPNLYAKCNPVPLKVIQFLKLRGERGLDLEKNFAHNFLPMECKRRKMWYLGVQALLTKPVKSFNKLNVGGLN